MPSFTHSKDVIGVPKFNKWSKNFDERSHLVNPRSGELNLAFCRMYCTKSSQILHSEKYQQILIRCKSSQTFSMARTTPKIAASPWEIGTTWAHLIHGSFGPPDSAPQTASRPVHAAVIAGLTTQRTWPTDTKTHTHTHTDRPRYAVWSNRPLSLVNAAMRPQK